MSRLAVWATATIGFFVFDGITAFFYGVEAADIMGSVSLSLGAACGLFAHWITDEDR